MAVLRGAAYTYVYAAFDRNTGSWKTGDAANHTVYLSKDGSNFVQATNSPSELLLPNGSPTGLYRVTLTASEMSANSVAVYVVSSTSGVYIQPAVILTEQGRMDTTVSSRATAMEIWNYTSRSLTAGVTVSGYESGLSPAEQVLVHPSNKIQTDVYGGVYLTDEDHQLVQNDVVAGLEAAGLTSDRVQLLDELSATGALYRMYGKVDQIQLDGGLVLSKAEQVSDKSGYTLASSGLEAIAQQVWNTPRGTRQAGTFGYYLDTQVSTLGGNGVVDWTADERAMIRYVLGIDGPQVAPSSSTPGWIKEIRDKTSQLQFDSGGRVRSVAESVSDKSGYSLSASEHAEIVNDVSSGLESKGYTSTRASYLDAAISSRLAASSYVPPDNSSIAAIKLKTDNLSFSGGNVNARAAVVADKSGYVLASSEHTSIAQAVWSFVVEAGYSALKLVRLFAAVLLGKCSGGGTGTVRFRDVNDTRDRVVASVDQSNNRTTVTLDGD